MHIRKLDPDNRRDARRFVRFPFALYRDSPYWVPPLLSDSYAQLDRSKHPFYAHSEAAFFLAESEGETLGRVAILNHRRFNAFRGQKAAFFTLFDAVNDPAATDRLFEAGFDWARAHGLTDIIGPKGFLQADSQGLLVEGFEQRPALGIAYNAPYYDDLVRHAGFDKVTDYFSGVITRQEGLPERFFRVADRVASRRGYVVKKFESQEDLLAWVPQIGRIYNTAFKDHWEFCPVTDDELDLIAKRLISATRPDLIKVVTKDDQAIGFVFAFLDISEGLQKARGRLFPLGWWHLMRAFKTTRRINFNGVGILPEYQGSGANAVLYAELTRTLIQGDATEGEAIQIEERNLHSVGDMKALGVRWTKKHRTYRRAL